MKGPRFEDDAEGWAQHFLDLGFFRFGVLNDPPLADWWVQGQTVACDDAAALARELRRHAPGPPDRRREGESHAWEDLRHLHRDPYRVAKAPEDADVYPGLDAVARLIGGTLPRISRGAFLPTTVHEAWRTGHEPAVAAVFGSGGKMKRGSWLRTPGFDPAFLADVNALAPDTGPFLYMANTLSEDGWCLFLTPQEARHVVRDRGWAWDPDQRVDQDGRPARSVLEDWIPPSFEPQTLK